MVRRILHKELAYIANSVSVVRPSEYGNPFSHKQLSIAQFRVSSKSIALSEYYKWLLNNTELLTKAKNELKGKNLACFCKIGHPCHADILLAIVNDYPLPSFLFNYTPVIESKLFPD